jgi:replicative DNA helicase
MNSTATKADIIKLFKDTFVCRQDVYAMGFPRGDGKFSYAPARDDAGNDLPFTDAVLWSHLKGDILVGVYPLVSGDKVGWVAMDFDGGADPVGDAFLQQKELQKHGLVSYVERSRSGNGAHLWLFCDALYSAFKIRRIIQALAINVDSYDRMFPNQDSAGTSYGNLIALPYHGKTYKEDGNSAFIDDDREPVHPLVFFENLVLNPVEVLDTVFEKFGTKERPAQLRDRKGLPTLKLAGSLKVCEFCSWVDQAKVRMPNQNQEPELYSLACQFVQLNGGKSILENIAKLHPYDQDRIDQKWANAEEKNLPETCATIRSKYGDCGKRCDLDLGISHPYELARIPFTQLIKGDKAFPEQFDVVAKRVIEQAEKVSRGEIQVGMPFGYDTLDDKTEIRDGDLLIVAALPSVGKAQPLDAKVLTPSGFVDMGSIRVGDDVIAADGTSTKVVGVFPQGVKDIYRVEFSDNTSTECCNEHLWFTTTRSDQVCGKPGTVSSLEQIRASLLCEKASDRPNHVVPWVSPVHFEKSAPLIIDPYVLGVYLGDGDSSSSGSVRIHSRDAGVYDEVERLLPEGDHLSGDNSYKSRHVCRERVAGSSRNYKSILSTMLVELGLAGLGSTEKFVPDEYLYQPVAERLALLQGLCDTDGYAWGTGAEYVTTSERLRDAVIFLARSLGGHVHVKRKIPTCMYKGEKVTGATAWRLNILFDNGIIPFRLPRKVAKMEPRIKAKHRLIVGVEYVGKKLAQCIEIEHSRHLYVTDNFIVTHNTAMLIDVAHNVAARGVPCYVNSLEMTTDRVSLRLLARRTQIDATRLEKGLLSRDEWETVAHASQESLPVFIDDRAQSLEQILDMLGELIVLHGKGPAFIDYLQLIAREPRESDREAAARAVVGLKTIAKYLDIPIIAFSQLGRMAEQQERDGDDPLDSWLASTSMIERTADVILYIRGKRGDNAVIPRRIRIHKERNRGTANTELQFELHQSIYRYVPRSGSAYMDDSCDDLF